MRVGDREREAATEALAKAYSHGQLTLDEYEERVTQVQSAKTKNQLKQVIFDLTEPARDELARLPQSTELAPVKLSAVFGQCGRGGSWNVPEFTKSMTLLGGTKLDFREANLPGDVHIHLRVVFGEVELIVPTDVDVRWDGRVYLGEFEQTGEKTDVVRSTIHLTGFVLLGEVNIDQRNAGESKRQAKRRRKKERKRLPG